MAAAPTWTPMASVDRSALRWTRVEGGHREYLLRSGETPLGRILWPEAIGSLARAEFAEGSFELHRAGFLAPTVLLRSLPAGAELGRLHVHLHRSTLEFDGRPQFVLRRAGMLVPAWQLLDGARAPVLHVEPVEQRGRLEGGLVTVAPAATEDPHLAAMLAVVWHFLVLAWFEEAAVLGGSAALTAVMGT